MKIRLKNSAMILMLIASTYLSASPEHDNVKALVETGEILSLEVILEKSRKIKNGKVIDIEFESKNGLNIYEIELLSPKGIVFELKFNAQTGEHLSTEKED